MEEEDDEEAKMWTRKHQKEDWNILKQTMRHEENDSPGTVVNYQEKADDLLEMRDELISKHMKYIWKVALLLKQEGELITRVQGIDNQEEKYPIDKYVEKMRQIVQHNLKIYTDLDKDLEEFQQAMNEEEEAFKYVGGS